MKHTDEFTKLTSFMALNVNQEDSIERWNTVREQAKGLYDQKTISRMDASGFVKEFYLTCLEERTFYPSTPTRFEN